MFNYIIFVYMFVYRFSTHQALIIIILMIFLWVQPSIEMYLMRRARGHGAERNGDGRKVQGMYFPRFGCLILHQRNTERSGTEMEERSRECIFQCSVALFYISVTRSGAEQRWKKGPGNVFSNVRLPYSTSA